MLKRGLDLCAAIAMTSVAYGGVVIEVLPQDAGPWDPGATVTMDVFLTQDAGGFDRGLRGIQFDFENSDPDLGLAEWFTFDYSSVMFGAPYAEFNELPRASTVYFLGNYPNGNPFDPDAAIPLPWNSFMLVLPEEGQFHIGWIDVTLPMAEGDYTLDVLNAPGYFGPPVNPDVGAWLRYGFGMVDGDPVTNWVPADPDEIAGGTFAFGRGGEFGYTSQPGAIVPEPASVVLLAIGVLAGMRRRRGA